MKRISYLLILACVMLPAWAWAQSGFDGTWVIDTHSVSTKGGKPDIEVLQHGTYWCKSCEPPYHIKADGQFHKVTGQSKFDNEAVQVVDAHTVKFTDKKDGKPPVVYVVTAAPDGHTERVSVSSTVNGHPVKMHQTNVREAKGPAGSHAISGTWRIQGYDHVSEGLRTMTLAVRDHVLHTSSPIKKKAMSLKLDGTATPIPDGNSGETLSATMPNANTVREERKRNGKLVAVTTYTLAPDGKRIHLVSRNVKDGGEFSGTMIKQ